MICFELMKKRSLNIHINLYGLTVHPQNIVTVSLQLHLLLNDFRLRLTLNYD